MKLINEKEIILPEELYGRVDYDEDDPITKATIRFRNNIRLANSIAIKYKAPHDATIDHDDIVQCAYIGLWKACINFDESKGYEFSTYAVPMIKGDILRMLRETNFIKLPRRYVDMRNLLIKYGFTLPLSNEEIDILSKEHKIPMHQILSYQEVESLSLDAPVGNEGDAELGNIIEGQFNVGIDISEDDLELAIDKIVSYVKPIHRDLVEEWLYATFEGYNLSQESLGKKYNLSQPAIRRILKATIDIARWHKEEIIDLLSR